jgi:hypothetical protein
MDSKMIEEPQNIDEGSHAFTFCGFEAFDFLLSLLYMLLFVCGVILATDQTREWNISSNGGRVKSSGVLYYLSCTTVLCFARCISFFLALFNAGPSDTTVDAVDAHHTLTNAEWCQSYQDASFQWEVHGTETSAMRGSFLISLILIVLSTLSTALFFTSYTYFAHSLTRVLDAVISSHTIHNNILFGGEGMSSTIGQWVFGLGRGMQREIPSNFVDSTAILAQRTTWLSASLLTLNSLVWISVVVVWTSLVIPSRRYALFADFLGQVIIAVAVLTIASIFSLHFLRALWFLRELKSSGAAGSQLTSLLQLRHVLGVICVCTLCFVVRVILIVTRFHLSASAEDLYFLTFEAAPTAFMLFALWGSHRAEGVFADGDKDSEYTGSSGRRSPAMPGAYGYGGLQDKEQVPQGGGLRHAGGPIGDDGGQDWSSLSRWWSGAQAAGSEEREGLLARTAAMTSSRRDVHMALSIDDFDHSSGSYDSTDGLSLGGDSAHSSVRRANNSHLLDDYF